MGGYGAKDDVWAPPRARVRRAGLAWAVLGLALVLGGCPATIAPGRFGVDTLDIRGVNAMDAHALRACLATHERPGFTINFGRTSEPECGVPPFDADRVNVPLLTWWWTDWPLFDNAVFERDLARIERWYRARGFYDARVTTTVVDPPEANQTRRDRELQAPRPGQCTQGCEVDITIAIDEGEPVLVRSVDLRPGLVSRQDEDTTDTHGAQQVADLPPRLWGKLAAVMRLQVGQRFDEAIYDRDRDALRTALAEASYARARVRGRVEINRDDRSASITVTVDPGPPCVFGEIRVENQGEVPADVIRAAAAITPGHRFRASLVAEAQRAVFALGAFSSVEVELALPEDEAHRDPRVPVIIRAVPGRLFRVGLGVGMTAGVTDQGGGEVISVPQWDIHGRLFLEHRNLLGGLRRLRIEERPRLVMTDSFPYGLNGSQEFGNQLRLLFRQPSFFEARTVLAIRAEWDYGPDPFEGYLRHALEARIGPERLFLDGRILAALRLRGNWMLPNDSPPAAPAAQHVTFLEQFLRLDLRDRPRAPRLGAFFSVRVHEAGYLMPASWRYVRVIPDARGYLPLPLGGSLAFRLRLGMLFISDADNSLDPESASLGPERFRLRGGGATSNRGYLPGRLGDSIEGGLRRWEASIEIRMPITAHFGSVLFLDAGDVYAGTRFRLEYLHLAVGLGLRVEVGGLKGRLDFGWQVPEAQVLGRDDRLAEPGAHTAVNFLGLQFPGAVHITIEEAF